MAGIENPLTHPTDDGTGFKLPEPVDQLVLLRTRNHELNDEINRLRHLESYKVWERKISGTSSAWTVLDELIHLNNFCSC